MLYVYDGANWQTIANDDYYVRELASGLDEVVFNVSIRDPIYAYILEEAVMRDRDKNYYIIKQVDAGNDKAKVVAQINIDDFKALMYLDYSNNSDTVYNTVLGVLPTGWSCVDQSQKAMRRTVPTSDTTTDYNVTAWEIMQDCCDVYGVRFRFDNANKIVYIIDPDLYTSTGAFATRDLNMRSLNYKGKSDNFITRLYATGADGMTFASINDGKAYVDNFDYTNKIICGYWSDERYTDPQSLLDDATAKLAEMARPAMSYDCDVLDLASTNPTMYGFEDFSLFNVVTLIDDAKGTRNDFQIVEKWSYPYYPVKNKVVLSSETPKLQTMVASIVNSISNPVSTFQQIIQSAIANSTALITGNHGGYVVFHDSTGDGYPDEILIMDTADISTATKVWRWNAAGLGYSSTGYEGTYGTAITMNGAIVADFITAGNINGALISAGTINANALSVQAQEAFDLRHDYLPYDAMTNLNRWKKDGSYGEEYPITTTTITVGGEAYNAIEIDATAVTHSGGRPYILTDTIQSPTIDWSIKFQFDRSTTTTGALWFGITYRVKGGASATTTLFVSVPAGTYQANTEYSYNGTLDFKALNRDIDAFSETPQIIFPTPYNFRGSKLTLYGLSFTGTSDDYKTCALSYTTDGLNSTVQAGSIISTINQSAESVSINASKINLTGDLSLRGQFQAFDVNDNTNYIDMTDGAIAIYYQGDNVFTVASTPLIGSRAGIFFGDPEDSTELLSHTHLDSAQVTAPWFYNYDTGDYEGRLGQLIDAYSNVSNVFEGGTEFYGDVVFSDDADQDHINASFSMRTTFHNVVRFYDTVQNSGGGTVFTSDRRKKRNIKDLVVDKAKSFLMALKPVSFKFTKDISKSNRLHHGFIAQDVKEAMGADDWGVYCEDPESGFIGLRYDEIIADLVAVVQDQEKRIEALERALNDKSDV